MDYKTFLRLLGKSKEYSMNGSILTITDYYTGESVKLELSAISQRTYKVLTDIEAEDDD